jgi:hypothetical protein
MTTLALVALSSLAVFAAPPANTIQLDGEIYQPYFRSDGAVFRLVEFVRGADSRRISADRHSFGRA